VSVLAYTSVKIAKFDTVVPVVIKDFHSNMPVRASFRTVNMGTTVALETQSEVFSEWVQCDEGFTIVNILVNSSKEDGLITFYFEWSMDGIDVHGRTMISECQRVDHNHPSVPIRARYFRMIVRNEDTQPMDLDSYAYLTQ
jgi:hypothetical protein